MMLFRCDNCNSLLECSPAVTLEGVQGTSGGLLLPESHTRKHFCSTECFWAWVAKYAPNENKE